MDLSPLVSGLARAGWGPHVLPARRDRRGPPPGGRPVRLGRRPPQVLPVDPVGPAQFDLPALAARRAREGGLLSVRHRREFTGAATRAPPGWCQSRPDIKARNIFRHAHSLAEHWGTGQGRTSLLFRVDRCSTAGGPQAVLTCGRDCRAFVSGSCRDLAERACPPPGPGRRARPPLGPDAASPGGQRQAAAGGWATSEARLRQALSPYAVHRACPYAIAHSQAVRSCPRPSIWSAGTQR